MTVVMPGLSSDRLPSLEMQVVPGQANTPRSFSIWMDEPPMDGGDGESAHVQRGASDAVGMPSFRFRADSSSLEGDVARSMPSLVMEEISASAWPSLCLPQQEKTCMNSEQSGGSWSTI